MSDLHDLIIHHEVHGGLDRIKPSYFDSKLPQEMPGKRYGLELMRLVTIGDGDLAYCGRCHRVFLLSEGAWKAPPALSCFSQR
jgi:hypothetical protein